jgi:hypothetical protein
MFLRWSRDQIVSLMRAPDAKGAFRLPGRRPPAHERGLQFSDTDLTAEAGTLLADVVEGLNEIVGD